MILLILPSAILIISIFCIPILRYFWLSNHAFSVLTGFNEIHNNGANWIRLINDQRFWQDLMQTFRFASLSVFIEVIIAILIALLLNQKFKQRGLVRSITLLPWALPTTIMALGWRWIFNTPYGPIDQFMKILGFENVNILSNPDTAWIATVISDVWKTTPFVALILLAGLQTIPKDLYEAFKLDGGSPKNSFFEITLPLLKPYIIIAVIFRLAQAFGVFDLIQIITGGGPSSSTESLAMYAYYNAMRYLDFGYSSTIMIGSFIALSLCCILFYILINTISFTIKKAGIN